MHKNKICPNSFTQNHLREDPRTDREGGRRMSLCHHSAEFSGLWQPQVNSTWVHKGPELWSQKTFSTEKKKKKSLSCTDFLSTFRIRDSNRIYLFPAAEQGEITAPCPTPAAASAVGWPRWNSNTWMHRANQNFCSVTAAWRGLKRHLSELLHLNTLTDPHLATATPSSSSSALQTQNFSLSLTVHGIWHPRASRNGWIQRQSPFCRK